METDSFWKEILEKFFKEFLQFFFPKIHRDIDFRKGYQFLDKEFQQISRGSKSKKRIVDKLVQVFLKNGNEKWLLIHIEIQGQNDPDFAHRMFVYYYRIFDKYKKDVLSLALLTDKNPTYRPAVYLKEFANWDFSVRFKFPLVKIIDYINYEFEKEYQKNVFAIVAHAFLKTLETEGDDQNRFRWKRQFVLRLYDFGLDQETIYKLYQFIEWIMVIPEPLEEKLYLEIKKIKGQNKMGYITYVERKALNLGIQKGLKRGMREGKTEGRKEGLITAIESVLEVKFGTVEPELSKALSRIKSLKKLEDLLHQAKLAKSADEFKKAFLA